MPLKSDDKDELVMLKIAQLERVGSILFFLIPLIILLIVGKAFAFNTLYLWQVYCAVYIVGFRVLCGKLSSQQQQLAIRRGWGNNRFYRLSWCYLVLSVVILVGYKIVSHTST
ncbi:hypothetical protein [Providencia huaxiensis]|uniref:Uncharacterized protein n=1 Tax=Providencia huaxiensis TaxID=2027290 RepID=A0A8I2AMX0_9GAMM|nr:hypothetical protein [Providencia huaxiensis]MBQ0268290.1 hypothetical protein [Providencia huaxiensis]